MLFGTSLFLFLASLSQSFYLFCLSIKLKFLKLSRNYTAYVFNNSIDLALPLLRIPLILKNNLINISVSILKFLKTTSQKIRNFLNTYLNNRYLLILLLLFRKKYLFLTWFLSKFSIKSLLRKNIQGIFNVTFNLLFCDIFSNIRKITQLRN